MDDFKNALKEAIRQKSSKLELIPGSQPLLHTVMGPSPILTMSPMSVEIITNICQTLMPNEAGNVAQGKGAQGILNVVNFGQLPLIAFPGYQKFVVYLPPGGANLFQSEWQELENLQQQGTEPEPQVQQNIPLSNDDGASSQAPSAGAIPLIPETDEAGLPIMTREPVQAPNIDPQPAQQTPEPAVTAPEPAQQTTEPPAPMPEPTLQMPEPALSVPEPAPQTPEPIQMQPLTPSPEADQDSPQGSDDGAMPFDDPFAIQPQQPADHGSMPSNSVPREPAQDQVMTQADSIPLAEMQPQIDPEPQARDLAFPPPSSEGGAEQTMTMPLASAQSIDPSIQATPTDDPFASAFTAEPDLPAEESPQAPGETNPFGLASPGVHHEQAPVSLPQDEMVEPSYTPQVLSPGVNIAESPHSSGIEQPEFKPTQSSRIIFGAELPGKSVPKGNFPINKVLSEMIQKNASDLHLSCGLPVTFRIDGHIVASGSSIVTPEIMESYLLPIMASSNKKELAETNDTDFSYEVDNLGRFRVNLYRGIKGIGCVMRQIPTKIFSADELGLPDPIRKLCTLSKGLVLVTGPTGSGKSTTLAAMIDLINSTRSEHILTIEDPIEFVHSPKKCIITQREVHNHTSSFSRALKAALREDPDIVLIGEMRDLETISIAIETAETGHLVFGTLHTTTAISTVDRIIDQFPEAQQNQVRTMLASSLKGVVSQALLRKKEGGRVAAHEIMVVTKSIAAQIRDNKIHMVSNDMRTKKADGNQLLEECLFNLVHTGVVDPAEALRVSPEPDQLKAALEARGISFAS